MKCDWLLAFITGQRVMKKCFPAANSFKWSLQKYSMCSPLYVIMYNVCKLKNIEFLSIKLG